MANLHFQLSFIKKDSCETFFRYRQFENRTIFAEFISRTAPEIPTTNLMIEGRFKNKKNDYSCENFFAYFDVIVVRIPRKLRILTSSRRARHLEFYNKHPIYDKRI